ncbi:hypothetical protein HYFRA_00013410 [Hymenoscyphus fraxineus]|uniref:Vacuolar ATPase assembly integral membrane protein VMA21 n=1 Tax=Hymenoscyphus fraxineus TaxID=746836 RepID=A0A9N9LAM6_9HELO|nr:hypothetical protein HYFRA_00013410 [Hymenoscyphus fraxineus]
MATRRPISSDRTIPSQETNEFTQKPGEKSIIAPAVPAHVIFKLLGFTLAMVVCPLGTYYLSLDTIFGGNSTYAGASAAIMANIVLMGYVIVAFREDQSDAIEAAEKEKKGK